MGYIYFIQAEDTNKFKIGITKNKPELRLKNLQTGNSENLLLIDVYKSDNYRKVETQIHRRLNNLKIKGEWFLLNENFNFQKTCKETEKTIISLKNNPFFNKDNKII